MKTLHSSMTYLQQWNPDQICRLTLQPVGELVEMNRLRTSSLYAHILENRKMGDKKERTKMSTYFCFLNYPLVSKFMGQLKCPRGR